MDFQMLAAEVLKPEHAELDNEQLAALLNNLQVTRNRVTPCWEVQKLAIESGYWASIVMAAEPSETTPVEVRGLCISCLAWIDNPRIQGIDFALPSAQAMVAGLLAASIITQQQSDDLLALGTETVSFRAVVGFPKIGEHHVKDIRDGQ